MNQVARYSFMAAVFFALFSISAQAAGPKPARGLGPRGGFLAQMDLDFGGDELATVYFEDDTTQSITAGQGLAISAGGYFRPVESSPFEIQASLGYKYTTTMASNADIHVSRTLLQLEALYRWPNGFYIGAGLMQHFSPELKGDGFLDDVTFNDATGFNTEIGWRWISLHYTNIKYSHEFFEDVDASHVGIRFTYRFGAPWTN
jgi:hypothetical protein